MPFLFKVDNDTLKKGVSFDIDFSYGKLALPVLSQGKCGNCYAFAVIGAVDMNARAVDKGWPPLSEQMLTDCNPKTLGCKEGDPKHSLDYLQYSGVYAAAIYPTSSASSGVVGNCSKFPFNTVKTYRISGRKAVPNKCFEIALALNRSQPVISYLNANNNTRFYKSGILSDCGDDPKANHAIVMVGVSFNNSNGD